MVCLLARCDRVQPEIVAGQPMVAVWFDINEQSDTPAVVINERTDFHGPAIFIGSAALSILTSGSGR